MEADSKEFLRQLLETPSPSGFESENLGNWRARADDVADEVRTDSYGNTVATVNPDADSSVVVAGHVDEIGMMVNHVTDDGYLYVKKIGGVDEGVAEARRVVVHGDEGAVRGVTGRKPVHLQEDEERDEVPDMEEVFVDVGAEDREEVEDTGVRVGSPVTYDVGYTELRNEVVAARGLDNRVGSWVAAEVLRAVDADELDVALHGVVTVQEELGLRGAKMAGYSLEPDVVLVVDVTFATDVPGIDETRHGDVEVGGGPTLKHGKENHPVVLERLRDAAGAAGVDVQDEAMMSRGATDADAFYVSRGGVPTASVGVPNRNMHTTSEVVDLDDLEGARDLFAAYAEEASPDDDYGRL